jgi:hypothetical protein
VRKVEVTERAELGKDNSSLVGRECAEVEYEGNVVEEIKSEEQYKCGK